MTKVISLNAVRKLKEAQNFAQLSSNPDYQLQVDQMDKIELLDEMLRFQTERNRMDHLSVKMMIEGQILFEALAKSAESSGLKSLARSYHRHLKHELANLLKIK